LYPLFVAGVFETGVKFATVSRTLAKLVAKFAAGVIDTGGNFSGSVVDTGGKFATGVIDISGATRLANISANLRKYLKRYQWDTPGLGGN
jgi:hypothetical protein